MDDIEFLYIGATLVWSGIFAYILYLHRMQARIEEKIELIELRGKKDEEKD
jgi:CcmD family protein